MNRRRLSLLAATVAAALAAGSGPARGGSEVFPVDRDLYPYYPSLIKWNKGPAEFTDPETCAECHPEKYEQWMGSVHALAFKDPIYQGELNKAVKAVGHDIARQCEGCHSPIGMVTGEIEGPGLKGLSARAINGVSCDVCHSISGTTHWQTPSREPENGSMVLTPGVGTAEGTKLVKRGPLAAYEECGDEFHECVESPLHLRAELCASCHQVYHYKDHFPIESTYLEWKHGPYSQKGILCQDCHMVDTETFLRSADTFQKPDISEYRHYFNGANYLLYFLAKAAAEKAGDEELAANLNRKYEMAVARLQAAADLELSPVYRDGGLAELKVRVKNIRAGHNLPTSLTNVRQMWLEVVATDESGKVLMTSGTLDADGHLVEHTRLFNSDEMGSDFHFAIDPWIVTGFSRHDTIPPRGYKDVYYGVPRPADGGPVRFEVRLRYRQADQGVAEALLSAVPKDIDLAATYGLTAVPTLPVVDMVSKAASFPSRM